MLYKRSDNLYQHKLTLCLQLQTTTKLLNFEQTITHSVKQNHSLQSSAHKFTKITATKLKQIFYLIKPLK